MPLLDYLQVRMAEGVVAWPRKISRKPSGISPSLSRCLHAPRTDLGTSRPSLLLQTRQQGRLFSVNIFSRPQERVTRGRQPILRERQPFRARGYCREPDKLRLMKELWQAAEVRTARLRPLRQTGGICALDSMKIRGCCTLQRRWYPAAAAVRFFPWATGKSYLAADERR
jgi:hypothetical protein